MNSLSRLCFFSLATYGILLAPLNASADPELDKGKAIFEGLGACSSCHGPNGAGDGVAAAALNPKPRNFVVGDYMYDTDGDGQKGTEKDIFNVLSEGAQKFGGSPMMVGRPDIPEADRRALAKYVKSLKQ